MKRNLIALAVALCAAVVCAGPQYVELLVKQTGVATNTATVNPEGYIDEIIVASPETNGVICTATTGTVGITYASAKGQGHTAIVVYTNAAVTSAVRARPRFIPTDNAGSALSSLTVAEPLLVKGDAVTLTVKQNGTLTNVLWRVYLKLVN